MLIYKKKFNWFFITALFIISYNTIIISYDSAQARTCQNPCSSKSKDTIRTVAKPLLGHVKSNFVDADGRVVILHGLNIMKQLDPWYLQEFYCSNGKGGTLGDDWVQFWVENGFNVARFGIAWAGVEPSPGVYDDSYIETILEQTRLFSKSQIFIILDFHQDQWSPSFGGNMFPEWAANNINPATGQPVTNVCVATPDSPDCIYPGGYLNNPGLQQVYDNFWNNIPSAIVSDTVGVQTRFQNMIAHVATFFKDEPYLMMYGANNELFVNKPYFACLPKPVSLNLACNSLACGSTFDLGLFADFTQATTQAIRAVDTTHMIMYELNLLEVADYLPIFPPSPDSNTVIGHEAYNINPDSTFTQTYQFDAYKVFCDTLNEGLFVTEFGADSNTDLGFTASALDFRKASWAYWMFLHQEYPPSSTDTTSCPVASYMTNSFEVVLDGTLPLTPDNIRQNIVNAITRPYPRVIAGTPLSYGYSGANANNQNGTFTFTYSKQNITGCGSVSPQLLTEIFIPKRNYPNGYEVKVVGAHIVSNKNNILLLRRQCDAPKVTVVITPIMITIRDFSII